MIMYSLYWLLRVLYFVFYVFWAWVQYKKDLAINWFEHLKEKHTNWGAYYHVIFLPTLNESYDVMKTTFENLKSAEFDPKKMIVVLATEERGGTESAETAKRIQAEYENTFHKLLVTVHPDGLIGEMKAKGANAHWAGQRVKEYIDAENIPYEKIIVSYFDIDTAVHPQYFAYLTQKYIEHPNPTRASFQPVVLYNNNMWDAPAITRVAAFGTTFWLMTELARPERMFTFSSHSMSWKALVDVNFWQTDIVTDDSRIFIQCFIRYNGDYSVTPMNIPVSMDTVDAGSFSRTIKNLYKQQRRWAWGVEHFPYLMHYFFVAKTAKNIPLGKRIKHIFNQAEGMYSWATAPILLFIFSRLPLWFVNPFEEATVLVQSAPIIFHWLMTSAMLGIFVSAGVSLLLLPPRPENHPPHKFLVMALQWAMLPITFVIFGAFPAIDAQTRLALGKYLGFWCTEKARSSDDDPTCSPDELEALSKQPA